MKAILKNAARNSVHQEQSPQTFLQSSPASARDVLRYRYHHGTNLGGIFVLERWLYGSMFDVQSIGDSELDAVMASIKVRGIDETRAKWEAHWSKALSDDNLSWLSKAAHCTTIRLPIGYFTLGPEFCEKTPFANQAAQIYVNAWTSLKKLVAKCLRCGIGVLLDFHALPGGANNEAHSGTSSGKAELWNNKFNIDLAIRCIGHVAREATSGSMDGVIGLQLCNEAGWDSPGMYKFYDAALAKISQIDCTLPVYTSDGWNLEKALRYAMDKNNVKGSYSNPMIVDTHRYYTFADKDTFRGPQELVSQVTTELLELAHQTGNVFENKGAMAQFVGEYSCTLSAQTWSKVSAENRAPLTKRFGRTQSHVWQQRSCGSAFWTFKMDWMPGGDWGFKEQVDSGNILGPPNLTLSAAEVRERSRRAEEKRGGFMSAAVESHQSYWDQRCPQGRFEHWRFAKGWDLGWQDARDFFCARSEGRLAYDDGHVSETSGTHVQDGADKIGALDLWVLKRIKESKCADKGSCSYGWEWEQGFRGGIDQFYKAVGV